jgi:hypothetical protein
MERTIGPQFVPIPMPTVSTMDQRAHRERGYRVKDPGVGGVSAACDRANPPTKRPQAGRDLDAHRDIGHRLQPPPAHAEHHRRRRREFDRRPAVNNRGAVLSPPAAGVTASLGTSGAGERRCDRGRPQRGDEAPEGFAEPDELGELDTPTGTEHAASRRTEIDREC